MAEALTHNLKLIGRYTLLRELRRERYTAAYLASDPVLNREVVVKAVQLLPAPGQEASGHDRVEQAFMRQAQAAGRLHHPHMITVFDAGRIQNVGYLALEKVHGRTLAELLAEGFRPGDLQAADIVARVADAVEYAHVRGIPHGHLGVSRIYLQEPERTPKVTGFGGWIDAGLTGDFELAATQAMLPYYESELSDEQRRKDIVALGALLYLLMTGTRADHKALRERRGPESPILERRPAAPFVLAEIAETALGLRGLAPYANAGQMRDALTAWLWGRTDGQTLPAAATIARPTTRLDAPTRPRPTTLRGDTASGPPTAALPARRSGVLRIAGAVALAATAGIVALGALANRLDAPAPVPAPVARTAPNPIPVTTTRDAPPPAPTERTSAQTTVFGPASDARAGAPPTQSAPRFK